MLFDPAASTRVFQEVVSILRTVVRVERVLGSRSCCNQRLAEVDLHCVQIEEGSEAAETKSRGRTKHDPRMFFIALAASKCQCPLPCFSPSHLSLLGSHVRFKSPKRYYRLCHHQETAWELKDESRSFLAVRNIHEILCNMYITLQGALFYDL